MCKSARLPLLCLSSLPALFLGLGGVDGPARAEPPAKRPELTREGFRRNCLMCHNRAAPEGVSAEILEGLHPQPGLRPVDAMPNLLCWRNCIACYRPDRVQAKIPGKL